MNFKKLFLFASSAILLGGCSASDLPYIPNGKLNEFDFANYSKDKIEEALLVVQSSTGYEISFNYQHKDDINSSIADIDLDFVLGAKENKMWAFITDNGDKLGYGALINNDEMTFYQYDDVWTQVNGTVQVSETKNKIDEALDKLIVDEKYQNKIKNNNGKGQEKTVKGRTCYRYEYESFEMNLLVDVDKYFGIAFYYKLTVTNTETGLTTEDVVSVDSIGLSNIVAPNFGA